MEKRFGFNIWTKNEPKDYINKFVAHAHDRNVPLVAIVDDLLPETIFNRSIKETQAMNDLYKSYMDKAGVDEVHFASAVMPNRENDLLDIIKICHTVSISTFMAALPQNKTDHLFDLKLSEVLEASWQLHVLDTAAKKEAISTWLTGKRSTALFRLAKTAINNFSFDIIDP